VERLRVYIIVASARRGSATGQLAQTNDAVCRLELNWGGGGVVRGLFPWGRGFGPRGVKGAYVRHAEL